LARWRRKLTWWLLGLFGLLVVAIGLALLALAHLDARPMKGWVQGAAARRGIAIDYDVGRVTLGGIKFVNLRIASPAADAAVAPSLVSIGSIDGSWSPLSKRLDALVLRDVALTIVRDADGSTSLDRWLAGMPASTPASDPLSLLGHALVPAGVEAHARIEGVTVTVLDRGSPQPALRLTGLTGKADVAAGALGLALGPGPVRLAIAGPRGAAEAAPPRELVVDLHGELALGPTGHGSLTVEAGLQRQTLDPGLPAIKQLVSLAATIDFEPARRRTVLHVERLRLLDGAATLTADARAEDVDTGGAPGLRPVIEQLALRVDLPAIARAVPAELGPIEVEGEPIVVTIKDAAATPSLQGTVAVLGKLVHARWREIHVRGLTLGGEAQPVGGSGGRAELRLALNELELPGLVVREVAATLGAEHPASAVSVAASAGTQVARPGAGSASGGGSASPVVSALWPLLVSVQAKVGTIATPTEQVRGIALTGRVTARSAAAFDAEATADVASVSPVANPVAAPGSRRVAARAAGPLVQGAHVELAARGVVLGTPPLSSDATLQIRGTVTGVRAPTGVVARAVAFTADAGLTHGKPGRARVVVDAASLVVPGLGAKLGRAFAGGPAHVELEAPALALDPVAPARTTGSARLAARYGGATVDATATGSIDEVAWVVAAKAPRIGPTSELVVSSRGTLRPREARISHDTQLQVGPTATAAAALRGARIHVISSGTAQRHDATISAAIDAPSTGGKTFGSARFDVAAKLDLARGAVDVHLTGAQPAADLRVTAALDAARAIHWQAKGRLAGLAAAAIVLPPGLDWARLSIELDGHGVAAGIIARVVGGIPTLVADPATALRGHQAVTITVRDLHYADAALTRADVDAATLKADVELGASRHAVIDLEVPAVAAVSRGVKLGARALAARLDATLGAHAIDAKLTLRAASVAQSAAPWYPIVAPALEVTVAGDPDASLALALALANPGGGTTFNVKGQLERGQVTPGAGVVARNSLALEGELAQTLDGLDAAPDRIKASGKLTMPFRVESGDLSVFRTTARVALDHVGLELPAARLRLTEINGELPIIEEIAVGPDGVALIGQGERGPFSQLRFPDYRPFAGDAAYLSIKEVSVRGVTFGPVAGNARVDHDVVALDQLELAALGGKITGQVLAELRGLDSRLAFRGKVTGVKAPTRGGAPGAGDPLDANLAIALVPYRYGLEGRAEIVRIGKDHLRALLDVWDPYRAEVAANRVRLALTAGYPKQVRLQFASGFASLAIELGGLAGVVRIDELRGIPIGPALAHWLAPILEP
jgi:hypothetical protein